MPPFAILVVLLLVAINSFYCTAAPFHAGSGQESATGSSDLTRRKRAGSFDHATEDRGTKSQKVEPSSCCEEDFDSSQPELSFAYQRILYGQDPVPRHEPISAHYRKTKIIGCGAAGAVYQGERHADNLKVAIKVVPKFGNISDPRKVASNEVKMLKALDHRCIVKLYDYFEDEDNFYIVTELFGHSWAMNKQSSSTPFSSTTTTTASEKSSFTNEQKESLQEYFGTFDLLEFIDSRARSRMRRFWGEMQVHLIFTQIYEAVLYLNRNGIFHCDLKAENILIDQNYLIKLVDFGSATVIQLNDAMEEALVTGLSCTKTCAAPEILDGKFYLRSETETWSLGVILYALTALSLPFNDEEALTKNLNLPSHISEGKTD